MPNKKRTETNTGMELLDQGKVYGFFIISSVCVCGAGVIVACLVFVVFLALVAIMLQECDAQQRKDRNKQT